MQTQNRDKHYQVSYLRYIYMQPRYHISWVVLLLVGNKAEKLVTLDTFNSQKDIRLTEQCSQQYRNVYIIAMNNEISLLCLHTYHCIMRYSLWNMRVAIKNIFPCMGVARIRREGYQRFVNIFEFQRLQSTETILAVYLHMLVAWNMVAAWDTYL